MKFLLCTFANLKRHSKNRVPFFINYSLYIKRFLLPECLVVDSVSDNIKYLGYYMQFCSYYYNKKFHSSHNLKVPKEFYKMNKGKIPTEFKVAVQYTK